MEYTTAQIAELLGVRVQSVDYRVKKEAWAYKKRHGRGGGRLFPLESLPADVRAAIAAHETRRNAPVPHKAEVPAVAAVPAALDKGRRDKALLKADLVRLYLDWQRRHGSTVASKEAFITAYQAGSWPEILRAFGTRLSWKSLERWKVSLSKAQDALALADRRGLAHRGKSLLTNRHTGIILGQILNPNAPDIAKAARKVIARCRAEGIYEPSEATVRRFVARYTAECFDEWTLFREGKKAWNDKCAISLLRDWSLVRVGDVVIADGHTLNFETINPETGKPKRMTLLLFYDGASAHPLGWEIMPTENTACISSAFRRTCILLGMFPKVVYLDNGKAFRARFFKGCADFGQAGICGLYEGLGCQVIHAWPYHGQSKPVERFFGTMHELEVMVPSYTGNSIEAKPARMKRGEDRHQRLYERMGGGPLTLEETHLAVASWFGEYANRPRRIRHLCGQTPAQALASGRGPGLSEADMRRLDLLMLRREVKTISKDGFRLNGKLYWHEALASRRHPIVVAYDDVNEPHDVKVYDLDGNLICTALDREFYRIAAGVHPAARALGTSEQQTELNAALSLKKGQEREASRTMTALLNTVVMPEVRARQSSIPARPERTEQPASAPLLSAEQIAEVEAAKERAREAMRSAPAYTPSTQMRFRDELARYDYLFFKRHEDGVSLTLPDSIFMEQYEGTEEFQRNSKRRYEQFLEMYAVRKRAQEEVLCAK